MFLVLKGLHFTLKLIGPRTRCRHGSVHPPQTSEVERLFDHCGQIQKETGIFAAGDLSKSTLLSLAQTASENLKDVNLCGVRHSEQRGGLLSPPSLKALLRMGLYTYLSVS